MMLSPNYFGVASMCTSFGGTAAAIAFCFVRWPLMNSSVEDNSTSSGLRSSMFKVVGSAPLMSVRGWMAAHTSVVNKS